jgi:lipid-A-disaccharide synthase
MIFYLVSKKVMICAGESSGELYGASLSRQLKKNWPDVKIFGIGGSRMKREGVSLIAPITHILGIVEVLKHLFEIRRTFNKAKDALTVEKPDVLVLIDYPDFNIALAKKAKSAGIPILYYVSPQVWAWRSGRVKTIASLVNRMAVLLPFEVDYYKNAGLPCEFVGHPIVEKIRITGSKEQLKKDLGLDPQKNAVALLPGSRPNEILKHESIIKKVAEKIHNRFPDMQIVVPLLSGSAFAGTLPDYMSIVYDSTTEALACSEAAAVTSGTATLETAVVGTPMVVFYKISPITFFIGKALASVRFISLVNILSGKEVVKELLQDKANADTIFSELTRIIEDSPYRNSMITSLNEIREIMTGKNPSSRVASIVGEMAGWNDVAAL